MPKFRPQALVPLALIAALGFGGWYVEVQRSKERSTLSGFFDNGTISARVVYTWRSPSVLFGISTNPLDGRYIKAYGLLDASVTIKLPNNLSLALTAANLTNNASDRYVGEPALATGIQRQHFVNGRNYGATLRYTFGG